MATFRVNKRSDSALVARAELAALILIPAAMLLALWLHLLPALLAGLLVHELVHLLAPRVFGLKNHQGGAKMVVVVLIVTVIAGLSTLLIVGVITFFRGEGGGLTLLLQKMADILDGARATLPAWVQDWLPATSDELQDAAVVWLRDHAAEVKTASGEVVRTLVHALIGMVIGSLIALREVQMERRDGALARAVTRRAGVLADAFRRVVFAQARISALNAALTAIYLLIVLPALGVQLPLKKTMVALTFIVGLIPIIGNLVSNTVIVVISLSHSLPIALGSLLFLVVIHKLEYFVNARIIGSQIKAHAWELLLAMLVMEAAFGVPGVIAAPIFYAYGKSELTRRGLI